MKNYCPDSCGYCGQDDGGDDGGDDDGSEFAFVTCFLSLWLWQFVNAMIH